MVCQLGNTKCTHELLGVTLLMKEFATHLYYQLWYVKVVLFLNDCITLRQ